MARMVDEDQHVAQLEVLARQAGDDGQRVDRDDHAHGRHADARQAAQQHAEREVGADDEEQRLPGPLADRLAVLGLDHQRLEHDGGAEDGQQDAQHQREVAGAHAGALADVVGGGAPRRRRPRRHEHDPGKEVFLTLDFHVLSPRKNSIERLWSQCRRRPMWVPPTSARPGCDPAIASLERRRGGEHFLERGQPLGHPQRAGQPQRPHAVGHGLPAQGVDGGLPG